MPKTFKIKELVAVLGTFNFKPKKDTEDLGTLVREFHEHISRKAAKEGEDWANSKRRSMEECGIDY